MTATSRAMPSIRTLWALNLLTRARDAGNETVARAACRLVATRNRAAATPTEWAAIHRMLAIG